MRKELKDEKLEKIAGGGKVCEVDIDSGQVKTGQVGGGQQTPEAEAGDGDTFAPAQ